jgi:hypothetical protein
VSNKTDLLSSSIRGNAAFSDNGDYRYWLERRWDETLPQFTYVLLNPSKAGAADNGDRTVPKLVTITRANGGGGFELVNLFSTMDTHQVGLHLPGAVGESPCLNDGWIIAAARRSGTVVVGWGDGNADDVTSRGRQAAVRQRAQEVWPLFRHRPLWCFRTIKSGAPGHPGRLSNDTTLVRYLPRDGYP